MRVETAGHVFLLFTDRDDLDADLVSLIYRHRWQIELFFKWIKGILGCRHWLAESPAGMTLQIYTALIASVLLVLWTGRKPTKRQWQALQLYWMGWVIPLPSVPPGAAIHTRLSQKQLLVRSQLG